MAASVLSVAAARADVLRLAVTTSFENSGLADILLPEIKQDLDLEVRLLVVGTGQAIGLGVAGDVDALLVHAPKAEEKFVADGHGSARYRIMYNDFVLIGPTDDPAGIARADSVAAALALIAQAKARFVSRGDDSGTHNKEQALWDAAAIDPGQSGRSPWYMAVGSGMGAALNIASGLNAYILSDCASWLRFGNKGDLALLFAGDPRLFNQYSYLPVDAGRHPHVKSEHATRLKDWLVSDRAKALIDGYQVNGVRLFTFNADAGESASHD